MWRFGLESTKAESLDGKASNGEVIELVVNSWFPSDADVPNNVWKPWENMLKKKQKEESR